MIEYVVVTHDRGLECDGNYEQSNHRMILQDGKLERDDQLFRQFPEREHAEIQAAIEQYPGGANISRRIGWQRETGLAKGKKG